MRTIRFTARFRKDFARVEAGHATLFDESQPVIDLLSRNLPLPVKCHDHPLKGEWIGFRDCHIRPDLVLIYRKFEPAFLELSRLGSHSELFRR